MGCPQADTSYGITGRDFKEKPLLGRWVASCVFCELFSEVRSVSTTEAGVNVKLNPELPKFF